MEEKNQKRPADIMLILYCTNCPKDAFGLAEAFACFFEAF